MDIIFRLLELLFHELLKRPDRNKPPAQSSLPGAATPVRPSQPTAQALAPRTGVSSASQDPVYDDRGWRLALAVLALIVLLIMVGVWILYIRGWLPGG